MVRWHGELWEIGAVIGRGCFVFDLEPYIVNS